MSNPSGTKQATKEYSKILSIALHRLHEKFQEFSNAKRNILEDNDYTLKERQAAFERLDKELTEEGGEIVHEIMDTWKQAKAELVAPNGTVNNKELSEIMQIIINADGALSEDTLNTVLAPIENNPSAIKSVLPLINKTGIAKSFENTHAKKILQATNRLKDSMDTAESFYKDMSIEHFDQDKGYYYKDFTDHTLAISLMNKYFIDNVQLAEQAHNELMELVNA